MAVYNDQEDRTDSDQDTDDAFRSIEQRYYDDEFNRITNQNYPINPGEPADPDELAEREDEGGDGAPHKPAGDDEDDDDKSADGKSSGRLAGAKNAAATIAKIASGTTPLGRAFLLLRNKKKRRTIGFIVAVAFALISGLAIIVVPSIGMYQWVHLAQTIDDIHDANQIATTASRTSKLAKWVYYKHDITRTRLGVIGNRSITGIEKGMSENGFKLNYDRITGNFVSLDYDPRVAKQGDLSNLEGAKPAEVKARLAADMKIKPSSITIHGNSYSIAASRWNIFANRRMFAYAHDKSINTNKARAALNRHYLSRRAGLTFNLVTTIKSSLKQSTADIARDRSARLTGKDPAPDISAKGANDQNGNADPKANDAADGANKLADEAKAGKLTSAKLGGVATAGVGFLCIAKTISDHVSDTNLRNAYADMMQANSEAEILGSKSQDGRDIDAEALAIYSTSLYSATNGSWTNANSLKQEQGTNKAGVKLPASLDPHEQSTLGSQILGAVPGLGPVCAVLGNSYVSIVMTVAGGPVSIITGGVFMSPAGQILFDKIASLFVTNRVDLSLPQFAGGIWGEVVNVGKRLASNEVSFSMGGHVLSALQELTINNEAAADQREQNSKLSIADRYLNPNLSTSLASHIIDTIDPNSPAQSIASVFASTAALPQTLLGDMWPAAHADTSKTQIYYDIPKVGFTDQDDNTIENPYKNADDVADIFNGPNGDTYKAWLLKCNNVDVSTDNGLDFTPGSGFNSDYKGISGDCKSNSDPNYLKIRMAVFDTLNAKAYDCMDNNNQQSCDDIGGTSAASTVGGSGVDPTGWVWPVHSADLKNKSAGLNQCWLAYYTSTNPPKKGWHSAIDIGVVNQHVQAAHNGIVIKAGGDATNTLIIDAGANPAADGKHLYAVYEHMQSFTVKVNQVVTAGQDIGMSGDYGAPGGAHLHFGISDAVSGTDFGTYANPWHTANPLDFLPANYDPALEKTSSESCQTADIQDKSSYGFAMYKTKGSFDVYK